MNVAVSYLTGTTKEMDSSTVRSTTGPVMESTAMAARRPSQQDSLWLLGSRSTTPNASLV